MLRSAAVIGVIFAMSPVRDEGRPRSPAPADPSPHTLLRESGRAWEALPEQTRRQLAEEVARLLAESAADFATTSPGR